MVNIFVLDENPELAAKYHCDKHIVSGINEGTFIMGTSILLLANKSIGIKPTHQHHPCTKWAMASLGNMFWLSSLLYYLNKEYYYRYGTKHTPEKFHKYFDALNKANFYLQYDPCLNNLPTHLTPFAICMDIQYIISNNPVECYRNYYIKGKPFVKWKHSEAPEWYVENQDKQLVGV